MKKFAIIILIISILVLPGCKKTDDNSHVSKKENKMIKEAIIELKEFWKNEYAKADLETDGYFQIKNTRLIELKENDIDVFDNIRYIIEFDIYSDLYGSAPYYINSGIYNNVVVFDDGTMEITTRTINSHMINTYNFETSEYVDSITDYNDQYNCSEKLK